MVKKIPILDHFNLKTSHQHLYSTQKSFHQLQIPKKWPKTQSQNKLVLALSA
jgi:hypothetical protein